MHRCRTKRERGEGTWITGGKGVAYGRLHRAGHAASVEAYFGGKLAGGLYGVDIGKCFFGESMFSDMENGSKAALIALARILDKNGYLMIDCQFRMPHLENMGGVAVGFAEYKELLEEGMRQGEHLSALGCSDFGAVDVGAFFNK